MPARDVPAGDQPLLRGWLLGPASRGIRWVRCDHRTQGRSLADPVPGEGLCCRVDGMERRQLGAANTFVPLNPSVPLRSEPFGSRLWCCPPGSELLRGPLPKSPPVTWGCQAGLVLCHGQACTAALTECRGCTALLSVPGGCAVLSPSPLADQLPAGAPVGLSAMLGADISVPISFCWGSSCHRPRQRQLGLSPDPGAENRSTGVRCPAPGSRQRCSLPSTRRAW